jgi:DNA repair photolyase
MRWSGQQVNTAHSQDDDTGQLALFGPQTVTRTFDTPDFRDITFYEVQAKSVLNRVPGAAPMFRWTINPYRGCTHGCVYCFARLTHTYLDLDAGRDFDTRIVVKVNAPQVLRRELARGSWGREHVAMGTNVDCYQRAEGRYRLMPGIIAALAAADTPFSILTKATLLLRDLDLLAQAADRVEVALSYSIGFLDRQLWRSVEPGTPSPRSRLEAVQALRASGLGCAVLMAPILPYLTDSPTQLRDTVAAIADAGATSVTPAVLHLRPGAREWYSAWLAENHPDLVERYRALYGPGHYAPKWYQRHIADLVDRYAAQHGFAGARGGQARNLPPRAAPAAKAPHAHASGPEQLRLL